MCHVYLVPHGNIYNYETNFMEQIDNSILGNNF